jgi:NAD(P)-dependent dehydrogenase (short-subunit alcohol dehydrogenase family)
VRQVPAITPARASASIAHVIAVLASDRSSHLTGATVAVDGGRGAI